jgi:endonuclease G, mitochondrial
MVAPKLMLTNHHVFKRIADAQTALAQFDYELDINGIERRGPSFKTRPDLCFFNDESLDFALVAINDTPEDIDGRTTITDFRYLRLNPRLGKINEGEAITIIQHPSGLPKQIAIRQNQLIKLEVDALVYTSDTSAGSSGSPLFNDTWQVVGLHSAGVPKKNPQGRWLTKAGAVADDNTDDKEIDWRGNRGFRASRIIAALKRAPRNPMIDELLEVAVDDSNIQYPEYQPLVTNLSRAQDQNSISTLRVSALTSGAKLELPIGFEADIRQANQTHSKPIQLTAATTVQPDQTAQESYRQPVIDENYKNRKGYLADFLKLTVPMPTVTRKSIAAPMENGDVVIPYQHFSVVMHKERRLALLTACNIDYSPKARMPDPSKPKSSYTRKGLGGLGKNDKERWKIEERIDRLHQLPDEFFIKDRQAFDRGHIVQRDDIAWGTTYAQAQRANGDSYHVTNCSPQVAAFNKAQLGGDWGKLENMVSRRANGEKLVVFAGPILDDKKDKPFVGVDDNRDPLIVRIPSHYWKVVIAHGANGLEAFGFMLEQNLDLVQWEFSVDATWASRLVSIAEIQKRAELIKFAKVVLAADMFNKIDAEESLSAMEIRMKPAELAS